MTGFTRAATQHLGLGFRGAYINITISVFLILTLRAQNDKDTPVGVSQCMPSGPQSDNRTKLSLESGNSWDKPRLNKRAKL